MALDVLRALHELERRVPDEVSVVGFERLRDAIELGRQSRIHHTTATELIVRVSTIPAAQQLASHILPV